MKRGANSCLQKTVFAFLFVGYVLFVVAFFIPRWFQFTQTGTGKQYNYGIFMACIRDDDGSSRCQYTHFKNVEGIITISWLDTQWQIMYYFGIWEELRLCWSKEYFSQFTIRFHLNWHGISKMCLKSCYKKIVLLHRNIITSYMIYFIINVMFSN